MDANYNSSFVPALGFHFLTPIYDWLMIMFLPRNFRSRLLQNFNAVNCNFLDFGCGTCETSLLFKTSFPNMEVSAVDVDEYVVALGKQKILSRKLQIDVQVYDGIKLPYPNEIFDCIAVTLVFCNLRHSVKELAICEIHRVLRANGQLLVIDWTPHTKGIRGMLLDAMFSFSPFGQIIKSSKPLEEYLSIAGFSKLQKEMGETTVTGKLMYYNTLKVL